MTISSIKEAILNVLDPRRDERAAAKFDSSGVSYNGEGVLNSEEGKAELERIGALEKRMRQRAQRAG